MLTTLSAPPSRNGTLGRVYGGDPDLLHVPDGTRRVVGDSVASFIDSYMRRVAENRTISDRLWQRLCPGCFMVVIFNAAVTLAKRNGQPLDELGRSLGNAFLRLADTGEGADGLEEILIEEPACAV